MPDPDLYPGNMTARGSVALAFCAALAAGAPVTAATEEIRVIVAVDAGGAPDEIWLDLLRRRLPAADVDRAAVLSRPLTPEERAWSELVASRVGVWLERMPTLVALFDPVEPPASVRLVLGNRGGEDAFTHDPTTVGFDLSRLAEIYGDARSDENRERIDRLFLHEYVHILQKAWLPDHPQPDATPFERAELDIWKEAPGNYVSMSGRWRSREGSPSDSARAALDRLEPRFVSRMEALACSTPDEERRLTADLASGPFAEKWGALTAALWLEQEAHADPGALRRFVQVGTGGVVELACRHLAPERCARLARAAERARRCP